MKKLLLLALLWPALVMAQTPSYPVRLDLQSPSRTFALKWAAGSSPLLSAYVSDGGRAYTNLTGWTGYVYVAVTPTAGVYVAASPVGSNRVNFSFLASQTATVGTFGVEVVLSNGTNTYRWGTGSLALSNSPALLGAGTVPLTGVFNWDLYTFTGTQPPLSASYTNPLAGDVTGVPGATVIGDGVIGTNNLDAEVRGLLATGIDTNSSAWTGLVALASAAYPASNPSSYLTAVTHEQVTGTVQVIGWGSTSRVHLTTSPGFTFAGQMHSAYTGKWNGAYGGEQRGYFSGGFELAGIGARQIGQFSLGSSYTGKISAAGAEQRGFFASFGPIISATAAGAGQLGSFNNPAGLYIGVAAAGAHQIGTLDSPYWATNNAAGAIQLISGGGNYLTHQAAVGSLLVGPGTASAPYSVTAAGGFYGDGTGVTNANAARLGGYLPTDFALLTTLSTGGYLRITSGAVTSNSMPGTRGEYRRSTTNAYFHDGSQWVTWVVSTNFSH